MTDDERAESFKQADQELRMHLEKIAVEIDWMIESSHPADLENNLPKLRSLVGQCFAKIVTYKKFYRPPDKT